MNHGIGRSWQLRPVDGHLSGRYWRDFPPGSGLELKELLYPYGLGIGPRNTAMYAFSSLAFWYAWFKQFRCYHCGGSDGYVSRPRSWFEQHGLPVFFLQPARCGDCYRRSYLPSRVQLLPRPQPMRYDSEQALRATLAAEGRAPGKETKADPGSRQNIAWLFGGWLY